MTSLSDRYGPWAVIAGASEGVGAAFARRLAREHVNVALVARRESVLEELGHELERESGVQTRAIAFDLARGDAGEHLAAATSDLDVGLLIANAGSDDHGAHFVDVPIVEWRALAQRNVITTLELCHHFAGPMRARGRGGLLLVSSGAGWGGGGRIAVYSATKAFDRNLAEGLWAELRPHGVDVLGLVLRPTDTPMLRRQLERAGLTLEGLDSPGHVADVGLERLPEGPTWSVGEDIEAVGPAASAEFRRELVTTITHGTAKFFGPRATP